MPTFEMDEDGNTQRVKSVFDSSPVRTINDLARELGTEPYGFAVFCGTPQNAEITEAEASTFRGLWESAKDDIVDVQHHEDGSETIHESLAAVVGWWDLEDE
jgi:hypothetical protein